VCNSCTHSTHDQSNLHARRHHAPEATRLSRRTGSSFLHYPHERASRISPERVNDNLILPFNAPSPVTQQKSFQQRKAYRLDLDQCACTVETAYKCRLFEPRDPVTRHRNRNHSPGFLYLTLTLALTMSSQDNSSSYLQQMTSVAGSVYSYMRLPVLVSSVLDSSACVFF
jgi:hypothetical protein